MQQSLEKLMEMETKYRALGFDWPDVETILTQIKSETAEIESALKKGESEARIREETGDLLHAVISLIRFSGYDLGALLVNVNEKFENRCEAMFELAQQDGRASLTGLSFEEILGYWEQAKKSVKPERAQQKP